jgi:nucleotide-binding universal stress UspA family protein
MTGTNRSILVPLDGSMLADAALPYAEALAHAGGERLRLCAVVEHDAGGLLAWSAPSRLQWERARWASLDQHLTNTATMLRSRHVSVSTVLVSGNPADQILAAAEAEEVTMVVMATHGRGGVGRSLIGSVADTVMRRAANPALLIRPLVTEARAQPIQLRRLLVPLDGSPLAESALPSACALGRTLGATVVLVRVEPFATAGMPDYGYVSDLSAVDAEAVARAEAYLERVRSRLPGGVRTELVVLRGFPAATLEQFARQEDVDLVVMATHAYGGLRRLVAGSVADQLIRQGLPVYLMHGGSCSTPVAAAGAVSAGQAGGP